MKSKESPVLGIIWFVCSMFAPKESDRYILWENQKEDWANELGSLVDEDRINHAIADLKNMIDNGQISDSWHQQALRFIFSNLSVDAGIGIVQALFEEEKSKLKKIARMIEQRLELFSQLAKQRAKLRYRKPRTVRELFLLCEQIIARKESGIIIHQLLENFPPTQPVFSLLSTADARVDFFVDGEGFDPKCRSLVCSIQQSLLENS